MSKSLKDRLNKTKTILQEVDNTLNLHSSRIKGEVRDEFCKINEMVSDIDAWIELFDARSAARSFLTNLETQGDANDRVLFGATRPKFHTVRLVGVQAYLSTHWSMADRLSSAAGRLICTPEAGRNESRPVQIVSQFLKKDRNKEVCGIFNESIRKTFGWPIGISYALRNHFIHEGGQLKGRDFFDGPTTASAFKIANEGWERIVDKAKKEYSVEETHHRAADWPTPPQDDLRKVLDFCEREMDDALGILIGSACHIFKVHVAYLLGEE